MVGEFDTLVNLDYKCFNDAILLYIRQDSKLRAPLMHLSVSGHAKRGHGMFQGVDFPESHVYDVLTSVETKEASEKIRRRTTLEVQRTRLFLEALVEETFNDKDKKLKHFNDGKLYVESIDRHEPLFDFLELRRDNFSIDDPVNFLKGACLVGHMDSAYWRQKTMERFQNKNFEGEFMDMGYGTCMPCDIKKLRENGHSLDELATKSTSIEFLNKLITEGSIKTFKESKNPNSKDYDENVFDVYIRQKIGPGICDDAALIWLGKNYGKSAYVGGMLVDTVDTFSKLSAFPITGGADELIGKTLNSRVRELTGKPLVTEYEITNLIYFAAKANTPKIPFSDSVRRFHQLRRRNPEIVESLNDTAKRGVHFTATQAHFIFIETGLKVQGLSYGFEGFDSLEFYDIIEQRIMHAEKHGLYKSHQNI